ncbi:MAG: DUF935 family protein [Rhodocyclaceae bacterium]|nr:DUF935 family protein [Rhodocyclaceae bacterium]
MADTEQTTLPDDVKQEIATVAKDITYLAFQGILRTHDDTLLTRGGGKTYRIYDELERDCHAYGVLNKRKLAVIARPWQVDPFSDAPLDKRAADVVRAQLSNMGVPTVDNPGDQVVMATNFDVACYNLLDALNKGFAVGEIMWDVDGGEIVAREIRPRDQRRFNFDTDYKIRLKTWSQLVPGEPVPPRKFIVHSFGAKDGSPYGVGLGSKIFWSVFFKRTGITFWLTLLDKFGTPTAVGTYPSGSGPEEQKTLLAALGAIAQDAGVVIPQGMEITLLEATRGGQAGYENFCRYLDEEMTFAVLGEAPQTRGSGGAQASAALSREVLRMEIVQADADLLSATLNATLSPWITFYNVPGARAPKIWRQVKEDEDLLQRSTRDKNLFSLGYRPTLAQIQETYGGEWEIVPLVVPGVGGGPGAAGAGQMDGDVPADFAESLRTAFIDQITLDQGADKLPPAQLQAQMETALKPVLDLIAKSADYAEISQKLAETFPHMDTGELEQKLARAMFVADVWGRLHGNDAS